MEKLEFDFLNRTIRDLEQWIHFAGKSLKGFYNPSKGVFFRESFGKAKVDTKLHPTATNRSFYALFEYLRFMVEDNAPADEIEDVESILGGVCARYLSLLATDAKWVRESSSNKVNMFTDSHLLISVSLLTQLNRRKTIANLSEIQNAAALIAADNLKLLNKWRGGKVMKADEIHDFVTLHIVRGLDVFYGLQTDKSPDYCGELKDRIKGDILQLLAFHYAGVSSKFDPAELAFSMALLHRFPTPDAPEILERSTKSILESQASDGAWPTARFISYEGHGLLHVASYEVGLTIANVLLKKLHNGEMDYCEEVILGLDSTFNLIRSSFNQIDGLSGWANDHTRREGLIESWSTAIVLTFLIHYRDALQLYRQYQLLKRFSVAMPEQARITWPDMIPVQRDSIKISTSDFRISDPTSGSKLTLALQGYVLKTIADSWIQRPDSCSIIMHGPPGTRKTSLARQIASTLRWPFITLTPPDFLRRGGLEGVEAAAAEIFDDLFRLRRVVILFDECEDFFKKRNEQQHLESRTIGAFITSGMLPRLQALRDTKWMIFMLATNIDINELDPAVTRLGRFDFSELIGYPVLDAQITYINSKLSAPKHAAYLTEVLKIYEKNFPFEGADESKVSFSHLDGLMNQIDLTSLKLDEAVDELRKLTEQKIPPSLTSL